MFPFRLPSQDGHWVSSLFSGHSLRTGIFQSSNQTLKADDLVELGMIDIYVEMQCEPFVTGRINIISVGEVTIE